MKLKCRYLEPGTLAIGFTDGKVYETVPWHNEANSAMRCVRDDYGNQRFVFPDERSVAFCEELPAARYAVARRAGAITFVDVEVPAHAAR